MQHYKAKGQEGPPMFTFIVVTKKINTRIVAQARDGYDNPPPGTIVDSAITIKER